MWNPKRSFCVLCRTEIPLKKLLQIHFLSSLLSMFCAVFTFWIHKEGEKVFNMEWRKILGRPFFAFFTLTIFTLNFPSLKANEKLFFLLPFPAWHSCYFHRRPSLNCVWDFQRKLFSGIFFLKAGTEKFINFIKAWKINMKKFLGDVRGLFAKLCHA